MRVSLILLSLFCFSLVLSCTKKSLPRHKETNKLNKVINEAQSFLGSPYKYAGLDYKGIDCSGLILKSFLAVDINLPRSAADQSKFYKEIEKKDIQTGDLLYFKVNSKNIDHTGIVTKVKSDDQIFFIHSSTSKGVREDNLFSKFWISKFVKATRPNYEAPHQKKKSN
jgi:probable lipoprotein NlpC